MKQGILLVLLLLATSSPMWAENKRIYLLEAVEKQMVHYTVTRTNAPFNSKGLKIAITNTCKEALVIKIDPAMVFAPADTTYQDLMLPGNEVLYVGPGRTNAIEVQTYCARSAARSPGSELTFRFKKQGDSSIIKTLDYLRRIAAGQDLAQKTVWFLTDTQKDLSSIYDAGQQDESLKMIQFLSRMYAIEIPAYRTERGIDTTPGAVALSETVLKLHVRLEWDQHAPEILSLSIFNENNQKIASYFEAMAVRKGRAEITASFETISYPKGNYYVRVYNDTGNIIKEEKVPLQ
ncbi:MAG: hypothetical protein EOP54_02975 [Sphingobacteriales bacterium]|nr:MAG: hypothetical protein EOP54_02975 [Sphingobacteriales bacterium]